MIFRVSERTLLVKISGSLRMMFGCETAWVSSKSIFMAAEKEHSFARGLLSKVVPVHLCHTWVDPSLSTLGLYNPLVSQLWSQHLPGGVGVYFLSTMGGTHLDCGIVEWRLHSACPNVYLLPVLGRRKRVVFWEAPLTAGVFSEPLACFSCLPYRHLFGGEASADLCYSTAVPN